MASINSEVSANHPVIVISSTSDSEQSDQETQEVLLLLVSPEKKSLRQLSGRPPSCRAQLLHVCSHSLINIISIRGLLHAEHGLTATVPKWYKWRKT